MNLLSIPDCQVLMQDIALELVRLDKRLAKINQADAVAVMLRARSALEAELPDRILELRTRYLQPATLHLLKLAQRAGEARLQPEDEETTVSHELAAAGYLGATTGKNTCSEPEQGVGVDQTGRCHVEHS